MVTTREVRRDLFNTAFQNIKEYFNSKHDVGLVGTVYSWFTSSDNTGVLITYTGWECYTQVLLLELQKLCEEHHLTFEVRRYRKEPFVKMGRFGIIA